jgi:hypothetical protein
MEDALMKARIILAAFAAIVAIPALAQAQEFYVVQDTSTKRCTVVAQKPATTTTVIVGEGKVFKTRTEAEAAVKTITVCKQ